VRLLAGQADEAAGHLLADPRRHQLRHQLAQLVRRALLAARGLVAFGLLLALVVGDLPTAREQDRQPEDSMRHRARA